MEVMCIKEAGAEAGELGLDPDIPTWDNGVGSSICCATHLSLRSWWGSSASLAAEV